MMIDFLEKNISSNKISKMRIIERATILKEQYRNFILRSDSDFYNYEYEIAYSKFYDDMLNIFNIRSFTYKRN